MPDRYTLAWVVLVAAWLGFVAALLIKASTPDYSHAIEVREP